MPQDITIDGTVTTLSDEDFALLVERAAEEERERGLANLAHYRADGEWCRCDEERVEGATAYFERDSGRHGFFHDPRLGGCGRITQSG